MKRLISNLQNFKTNRNKMMKSTTHIFTLPCMLQLLRHATDLLLCRFLCVFTSVFGVIIKSSGISENIFVRSCVYVWFCVILTAGAQVCSLAGLASKGKHVKMTAINLTSHWPPSLPHRHTCTHTDDCQFIKRTFGAPDCTKWLELTNLHCASGEKRSQRKR